MQDARLLDRPPKIGVTPSKIGVYPLSVSAANTYKQCPRLYYYRYVLGYRDTVEAPHLAFGTKIDRLLEVLDHSNLDRAVKAIPEAFPDPFDQLDVEVLLRLWDKQFGQDPLPPLDLNGKPGSQYPFKLQFNGNPVTGILSMDIAGFIDKVTIIDGEIGFMEGKTTGKAIDERSVYWKKLAIDPQIACYAWALSKELGKPVNRLWYQVVRRPTEAANPFFAKTYTKNKVECAFTLPEYKKRVFSILDSTPKKALVARRRVYIEDERKEVWVTEHAQTWIEIQARKDRQKILEEGGIEPYHAWPRNHHACDMYDGCPFWEVCIGEKTVETCGKFVRKERKEG